MTAFNFATMRPYSGQNALLAGNGKYPAFATFNQIRQLGFTVNKGAKAVKIFCGYQSTEEKDENGKLKKVTIPKRALVFDICDTNALQSPEFVEFMESELAKLTPKKGAQNG